jgi:hypothetical protein
VKAREDRALHARLGRGARVVLVWRGGGFFFFKNEAIGRGVVGLAAGFGGVDAAFELDLFEQRHGFFELAVQALAMEAEGGQGPGL